MGTSEDKPVGSTDKVHVAAIDIGTNSFHLMVASVDNAGHLEVLDTHKEAVRFGQALDEQGVMPSEKIDHAVAVLNLMKSIADPHQPIYRVLATQATRAATNYEVILRRIYEETGLRVEIIDGLEEARLTYLGMRYCHELADDITLGLDIGGGSTEVVIGKREKILFMTSIKLGALTSTKRFFDMGEATDVGIRSLKDYILTRTAPLLIDAKNFQITRAFATSGTAKAIGRLHHLESSGETIEEPNGYQFDSKDVNIIADRLTGLKSPRRIKDYYELDSRRSEIILAGTLIFQSISELFRVPTWTISTYGIREGIILDTCSRRSFGIDSYTVNQQWRSIKGFAKKLQLDANFAESVQAMATLLYDQCLRVLPQSVLPNKIEDYRWLVEAAAYLNEAGKFISFSSYHKHSYYLLANSNLLGFSREEKHILALINRFSRKKPADTSKRDTYPYLRGRIDLVNFLAACIRAARCINRSRLHKVQRIKLEFEKGKLVLALLHRQADDIQAEVQALKKELKVISKSWGTEVTIDQRLIESKKT